MNYKHRLKGTRFYGIYHNMQTRCLNLKSSSYKNYGGRGIGCKWSSFMDFKRDMYDSYLDHLEKYGENGTTIERINNNKDYRKENCTWATRSEQNKNTRRTRKVVVTNGLNHVVCTGCKVLKPFNDFHKYKGSILGIVIYCKDCMKTKSKPSQMS